MPSSFLLLLPPSQPDPAREDGTGNSCNSKSVSISNEAFPSQNPRARSDENTPVRSAVRKSKPRSAKKPKDKTEDNVRGSESSPARVRMAKRRVPVSMASALQEVNDLPSFWAVLIEQWTFLAEGLLSLSNVQKFRDFNDRL